MQMTCLTTNQKVGSSSLFRRTKPHVRVGLFCFSGGGAALPGRLPATARAFPHGGNALVLPLWLAPRLQPSSAQCLSTWLSTSQPVCVTSTRSSTRTPNSPGR